MRQTMQLLLRISCTLKWAAEGGGTAAAQGLRPPSHKANAEGFHVPKLELLLRGLEGFLAWHRPSLPQHQHCKECSDMLLDHSSCLRRAVVSLHQHACIHLRFVYTSG